MKKPCKVNILGTEYKIEIKNQEEMRKLSESEIASMMFYNGLCDSNAKAIYLDESLLKTPSAFNKTLRHEIIHGFFFECGLDNQCDFAVNESNVDFIALQFPKLYKIFNQLGIMQ